MRHLRQIMGIITPIPVANDVNRDEALIRTPIPVANGGNRYEATMGINEELQRQNDRLQLLLNLTSRITSSLDLREVLRAIAANIREVIQADLVTVSLPDAASGKIRVFAMDFPHGKGVIKEDLLVAPSTAAKKAMDTLKPVVLDSPESDCVSGNAEGIRTQCIIPLVNRGRLLGILCPCRTTETPFVPEDVDFLSRASGQIAIAIENALAYHEIYELKDKLAQEKLYLEEEIRNDSGFERIIGKSAPLKHILELVDTVAPSDSTVLLLGDTGTGKELIARAIHDRGRRKDRTFVKLNCAAIPTGLLERELFGHEKGAFTGAIAQRIGRFELDNRGTVFLDAIGEIPLELQPKLLRVLQEREFERLGSSRTLTTDARLIAATNRDLASMVEEQKFRSDLFYRLNVFPVRVPPLRERPEDIPLLVRHFTEQCARRMNKKIETISTETLKQMRQYHWPGNIRELQNVIERAVILSAGPVLSVPLSEFQSRPALAAVDGNGKPEKRLKFSPSNDIRNVLEETERKYILSVLSQTDWVVAGPNGAAARLGMKRSTLQLRIRKLGLSRDNSQPVS